MVILKVNENKEIQNFFVGNDMPPFDGIEYDENMIDVHDFIENWFLYSYVDGQLYKDEQKVSAYQTKLEAERANMEKAMSNPSPTLQEQINAILMREIAILKAQVTAQ